MGESPSTPAFVVAGGFLSTTTARPVVKKRSADERKGTDNFELTKRTTECDEMFGAALDKVKRALTPGSSPKKAKKQQKKDDDRKKPGSKEEPIDLISPNKKLTFDEAVQKEEKVEEISVAAKTVKARKRTKVVRITHLNNMTVTLVHMTGVRTKNYQMVDDGALRVHEACPWAYLRGARLLTGLLAKETGRSKEADIKYGGANLQCFKCGIKAGTRSQTTKVRFFTFPLLSQHHALRHLRPRRATRRRQAQVRQQIPSE